jgi:hypothetical protein
LISAVFFSDKISGKVSATLSASVDSISSAPIGESVRVNINAFDNVALTFKFCLTFLRTLVPLLPRGQELVAIFEDGDAGSIVFLSHSSDSDSANVVSADLGHEESRKVFEPAEAAPVAENG